MKKLVDPGVVLVVSDPCRFVAPAAMTGASPQSRKRLGTVRNFPNQTWVLGGGPEFVLSVGWTLKGGTTYAYDMTGLGDASAGSEEIARLVHSPDFSDGNPTGGVLYNASVRSRTYQKKAV